MGSGGLSFDKALPLFTQGGAFTHQRSVVYARERGGDGTSHDTPPSFSVLMAYADRRRELRERLLQTRVRCGPGADITWRQIHTGVSRLDMPANEGRGRKLQPSGL